jgi:uncharacterized DUF497 family protein
LETARQVFDDPFQLTTQDREVETEPRWQTIGMVKGIHVIVVAHTISDDDEVVRIVSARKATPGERNLYAQCD